MRPGSSLALSQKPNHCARKSPENYPKKHFQSSDLPNQKSLRDRLCNSSSAAISELSTGASFGPNLPKPEAPDNSPLLFHLSLPLQLQ
ncbi:hypothetical protein U1Q18_003787 [Sarracenia purpurea var. burkii]